MSTSSSLGSLLSSSTSASSAIDVSSILQAAFGSSSSGIDVNSAVSAGVTAARQAESSWINQSSVLSSQASALSTIQSYAESVQTDLQALNLFHGPLQQMSVSSSNSSVVTATASSGATAGSHVVVVNNLATTASWTSDVVANASTPLAAGSFTITTADGTTTTISTGTGSSTLADVAAQINGDKLGLTASVITDANGARLAIVSNTSGAAANFTVTPGTDPGAIGFSQAVTGKNASLSVDGITIASASNTVSDTLAGLTINLQSANPGVEISLSVTPDTTQATAAINQFVNDYNTLVNAVNNQFVFNGSSQGVLATDSSLRSMQTSIQNAMSYTAQSSSGDTLNLASFGISLNNDGTLTVNSATLTSALQNNPTDLQNFFVGTSLDGFAGMFNNQLDSYTSSSDGAFTVDLKSMTAQEQDLTNSINNYETNVITPLQQRLQTEYSQAAALLQQLPAQTQQINALLGYYNKQS